MISLREENFIGRELIFKEFYFIAILRSVFFIKVTASEASISGKISPDSVSTGLIFKVLRQKKIDH